MSVTFFHVGDAILSRHHPSGDEDVIGYAENPMAAEAAAEIITRANALNNARKYTASARMYARLDGIAGYREA